MRGEAGLSPGTYGEEIHYALRYAVFAGRAVRTETGHHRITETGWREHDLEVNENRGCGLLERSTRSARASRIGLGFRLPEAVEQRLDFFTRQ